MTTQSQTQVAPLRAAFSWRLLLAWVLAAMVPTLAASLPMGRQLAELLGHVPHADASRLDPLILIDTIRTVYRHPEAVEGAMAASLFLTLLMAPFAAGLAVAAYPEPPTRFFSLVAGAFENYGRLFRLMLVSVFPLGIAGGVSGAVMAMAEKHAEKAVLDSSATSAVRLALLVTVVLLLLAELTVEAARAQFAVDETMRSALRAWWRGMKLVLARPGAALGRFLVPTLIGLGVAALFGIWRVHTGPWAGLVVAQLAVAAIGWGRAGRVLALAELTSKTRL
jgi:hypothetical protein